MDKKDQLSEAESLRLITDMIQKVKHSYHDTGISPILWGSTVFIASMVTYIRFVYNIEMPFDIWLITLFALVPQVWLSIKENKNRKFRSHNDIAMDAVWLTYAIMLFGLIAYQNIIPVVSVGLIEQEGWQMMKHTIDNSKPDEVLKPFIPSSTSLYLLVYAMPTFITGIIKQFKPMVIGALITFGLFVASCFTASQYDMLFSALTALVCWFIPGIILRMAYLKQRKAYV